MSDVFVGQILLLPYTFAPRGFAFCNGALLPISQNTALFSLLGTIYGGNGVSTFALPDLRGRAPVMFGQGPGLSNYDQGQLSGSESVTLALPQIPVHTHTVTNALTATAKCRNAEGAAASPLGTVPAVEGAGVTATYSNAAPDATMNAGAIALGGNISSAIAGTGGAHANLQPYLTMNYCIALVGIFPSRP